MVWPMINPKIVCDVGTLFRVNKFMCILLRCCHGHDAKGEDLEMRNVSSKREQWSDWRRSWLICWPEIECAFNCLLSRVSYQSMRIIFTKHHLTSFRQSSTFLFLEVMSETMWRQIQVL